MNRAILMFVMVAFLTACSPPIALSDDVPDATQLETGIDARQSIDASQSDVPEPLCLYDAGAISPPFQAEMGILQIAAGGRHTCALMADTTVRCWGDNSAGQLGDGTNAARATPTPVRLLSMVREIATGGAHSCAALVDGTLWCWGANESGQLGDGTNTARTQPTQVTGLDHVEHVALGQQHSCAIKTGGAVYCWGLNIEGELGLGTNTDEAVPSMTQTVNAASIALGVGHTCAVLTDATVHCWGANAEGQLGDCAYVMRLSSVVARGLTSASQVSLGFLYSCARLNDGTVSCWGIAVDGQTGYAPPATGACADPMGYAGTFAAPMQVPLVSNIVAVAIGDSHSCALTNRGDVQCWGADRYGQLGFCAIHSTMNATAVPGLHGITEITAGSFHTCARQGQSAVYCWGDNEDGRLGDGTNNTSIEPVAVRW